MPFKFHAFCNTDTFTEITDRTYYWNIDNIIAINSSITSTSKTAKIKGAKIIQQTKVPKLMAAKNAVLTVSTRNGYASSGKVHSNV